MSIAITQPAAPPQLASRVFHGLRIALGLFLLVTAALKLHGLAVDPLAGDSFLASPRLQIAAIEVELLLGLWLLSGWQLRAARIVALTLFLGCAPAPVADRPEKDQIVSVTELGTVFSDDASPLKQGFVVKNSSGAAVRVAHIEHSCACSKAELGHRELGPDGETTLTLHVDLRGRVGP